MAGRSPHNTRNLGLWTQSNAGVMPLAPAPLLPYPSQLNVPLSGQEVLPAAARSHQEEELTTDLHFPVRLHYMLTDIHKEGLFTHIVSWQPHGRCFVVHDKKQFVDKILCLWFRQSKWASFQRQLNMYGFSRLSHGLDKGGYYHELFIQDQPKMAQRIQRQKVKGTGPRRAAQPDQEPNFYAITSPRRSLPPQFPFACGQPTSAATITLRNSLASHILAAPVLRPVAAAPPRVPVATLSEEDEKDLDALAALAAWF